MSESTTINSDEARIKAQEAQRLRAEQARQASSTENDGAKASEVTAKEPNENTAASQNFSYSLPVSDALKEAKSSLAANRGKPSLKDKANPNENAFEGLSSVTTVVDKENSVKNVAELKAALANYNPETGLAHDESKVMLHELNKTEDGKGNYGFCKGNKCDTGGFNIDTDTFTGLSGKVYTGAELAQALKSDQEINPASKENQALEKQKSAIDETKIDGFRRLNTTKGSDDYEMLKALGLSDKSISAEHNDYYFKEDADGNKTLMYDGRFEGGEGHLAKVEFKENQGLKLDRDENWQVLNKDDEAIIAKFDKENLVLEEKLGGAANRHLYTNALAKAENYLKTNLDEASFAAYKSMLNFNEADLTKAKESASQIESNYESSNQAALTRALKEINSLTKNSASLAIDRKDKNDDSYDKLTELKSKIESLLDTENLNIDKLKESLGISDLPEGLDLAKHLDDSLQTKISKIVHQQNLEQRKLTESEMKKYNEDIKSVNKAVAEIKDKDIAARLKSLADRVKAEADATDKGFGDKKVLTGDDKDKLAKLKEVAENTLKIEKAMEQKKAEEAKRQAELKKQEEIKKQALKSEKPSFKPKTLAELKKAVETYAAKGAKTIKLQFSTSWCGHCRLVERNNSMAHTAGQAVLYVDGDNPQFQALKQQFGVNSYPDEKDIRVDQL